MNRFNLSAIAVRERAVTLFFLLLLVAAGAYAFLMLGRAEDPSFTIKTLTVTTAWPGATAREMQDLVAEPLEKRLQELTWYDRVETTTRPGYAYMTVTLKDSTPPYLVQEEFYQARKKLGDEARNLPPGVFGPFVNDEYSDVSFALYALKARGMPMRELVRQAESIRQDLLHVPGIKKINILGERPEQIFVEFSYAKLATLGVSAQDIKPGDNADVADGICQEAPRLADTRYQDSSDCRTQDTRRIENRGVERDGIHQILAPDHVHDESLAGGDIEGVHNPEQTR
jgi:multidrug efflux pump subunit AcrB